MRLRKQRSGWLPIEDRAWAHPWRQRLEIIVTEAGQGWFIVPDWLRFEFRRTLHRLLNRFGKSGRRGLVTLWRSKLRSFGRSGFGSLRLHERCWPGRWQFGREILLRLDGRDESDRGKVVFNSRLCFRIIRLGRCSESRILSDYRLENLGTCGRLANFCFIG